MLPRVMRTVLLPLLVFLLLACAALAQRAYYLPQLPAQVAVHSGPSGKVDRWETKADFVAGSSLLWLTAPVIFAGVGLLSALSVRFLPEQFVNLPRKDYWLATPHRRRQAALIMLQFFLWIMAGAVALGLGITQAMIQATFSGEEGITLPVVGGFILFMVAQIALLLIRLSREPKARRPLHEGRA
jgi:uncharacterized membrane protein